MVLSIANNMSALLVTADKHFGELVPDVNRSTLVSCWFGLPGFHTTLKLNWSPLWRAITLQNYPVPSASFRPE